MRKRGRALKRTLVAMGEPHRRHVFRGAMRRLLAQPYDAPLDAKLLSDLIYGWGFASGSMKHEYAAAFAAEARTTSGAILECGSGLSTLLLGWIADGRGTAVRSLEHNPFWANRVRSALDEYGIRSVEVCESPLRDYGPFTWYDPPRALRSSGFSLVVCDGPPACTGNWTPGGRYGLLPVMRENLLPGCVILLDDADRAGEQEVLGRWAAELGTPFEIRGTKKPYGVLVLPHGGVPRATG